MLSNPPYGKSWKTDLERICGGNKKDVSDPRFIVEHKSPYGDEPALNLVTRTSDGQLMFLVNKLAKMKQRSKLGSRVLRPSTHLSAKYLYYVTHSKPFREIGAGQMKGSAGQQRVPTDYLAEFVLPYPARDEQDEIVTFLDRKLVDIDRFIANKRRLIALLEEERQRSVFEIVTRGIESDRPLKPTEVEWLPTIPEQWTMRRNGTLFVERKQNGREGLPVLMVSINTGVTLDRPNEVREQKQIDDKEKYAFAAKGDIAFNMMRMWQGAVGVVPVDGNVSPAYIVCRPRAGVDAEYYALLFRTKLYQGEVFCHSYGIVPDRNRLYWIGFKSIHSPYPPFDEQQRIVAHIREMRSEIETAKAKALREIELIEEFRASLIAEAVTGKIDVRSRA